ncbi:MAG: Rpn family recombination-promoting nuclease/putative transposase [Lachnospiraceae bacterium]|nr:Rpn family recombination-promoting nuclease/putative transposase [Lachnospiraceae bacterium]
MGAADSKTNEYMSDNNRFADLFNYYLYDGEQVIDPDNLRELDPSAVALPYGDGAKSSDVIQKYRDVFKLLAAMEDDNAEYLLLGVEDQTHVHYAMPVKDMLYDAAQYAKQIEQTAKINRAKSKDPLVSKPCSDEFLSGFYKEDKLHPVITLVVYWSPDEWDGPLSIHEMLSTTDERILKHVPDYRINLITPRGIDDKDFEKFRTSLAEAFQFIKYSKDKEKLAEVIAQDADYEHLDRRTVEVINEVAKAGIQIPQGAEEVNMCIAIQEMQKEAATKATDKTLLDSIRNLMDTLKLTAQQAMDALKISADDQKRFSQML